MHAHVLKRIITAVSQMSTKHTNDCLRLARDAPLASSTASVTSCELYCHKCQRGKRIMKSIFTGAAKDGAKHKSV